MNLDALKRKIAQKEIDTVLVVFPDTFGRLMGKRFTGDHFIKNVAKHGTHGCSYLLTVDIEMEPLEGFQLASWEKGFGDFELRPDPDSYRILPWLTSTALVMCDCHHEQGQPVDEAPRCVLRKQLAMAGRNLTFYVASELEFFLFNQTYREASTLDFKSLTPSSTCRIDYHTQIPSQDEPIMRRLRNQMTEAGITVESSKGEWGVGQHEVNFKYDQPLAMSDMHVLFKHGAREIAQQQGKSITFMPKPSATDAGSSCHLHVSVFKSGTNLFWDQKKKNGSLFFRQFLGGLLKYSRELSCFLAPSINSYKRYQPGSWAPTRMAWAHDNRTTGFRVVGHGSSFRIENRMPGSDANPYLAFAATLAAGMAGVREHLDCGPAYTGNAYLDASLQALPHSLKEAAVLLHQSKFARKAFGDHVVEYYAHAANLECQSFDKAVTNWEQKRYFEQL